MISYQNSFFFFEELNHFFGTYELKLRGVLKPIKKDVSILVWYFPLSKMSKIPNLIFSFQPVTTETFALKSPLLPGCRKSGSWQEHVSASRHLACCSIQSLKKLNSPRLKLFSVWLLVDIFTLNSLSDLRSVLFSSETVYAHAIILALDDRRIRNNHTCWISQPILKNIFVLLLLSCQ